MRAYCGVMALILWAALCVLPAAGQDGDEHVAGRDRVVKIPVRFASAADISLALGGIVLDAITTPTERQIAFIPFVPEGLRSLVALSRDNTLLVRGSEEGISELRRVVALLDVPEKTFAIQAAGTVTVVDRHGRKREGRFSAEGSTTQCAALELRVEPHEAGSPGLPGLASGAHVVRVTPRAQGDGTVLVEAVWDAYLPQGGAIPPPGIDQRFVVNDRVRPGRPATVANATYHLGGVTVRLQLSLRVGIPGSASRRRTAR